ncbi:NAD(P)-dependent oxidoreductase [Terrihalobacillus insolitus]|uniref:NAD(P)-dependent oxidoreductase n=1 Tax=Terrihalobacillus insolitus TaxID=2950438 RepID=UPI0023415417|nr:SDR family oxidoreductase [Terrihalobacillus insolitus]MDC3413876.1 SDR family oxidoreductase [Terrihalobacillus insolitus]
MKLVIFGSTGRTGIPLLNQALEKGHEVTVLVRNKNKLNISHNNLTVVEGDVLDYQSVEKVIIGQDAVLSVIGHTKNGSKNLLTNAATNMTNAMEVHHVKRLISLTGAGVEVEKDVKQGIMSHLIHKALTIFAKELWLDSINQKDVIVKTELDWTIVRGPRLLEGEKTEQYQTGYFKFNKPMINRADVAHFILEELERNQYVKEYPLIGMS